jgi:hypothetical protein
VPNVFCYQCDETRPACKNCAKRKSACSFATAESTLIVVNSPFSRSSSDREVTEITKDGTDASSNNHMISHDAEVTLARRYCLKGDDNDRFRLMHHFAISTSFSISNSLSEAHVMRDVVPALAFEYDFLLSGILAVSSLHLAIINPSAIHSDAALKHHSQALKLIRPHLLHVTPENVSALFPFSILIACYSFGIHETPCHDPIGEIVEVFTLLRGIGDIVKAGAKWLEQSPFAQQSILPAPSNPNASLAPEIEAVILSLTKRNSELIMDSTARTAYASAIALLRDSFLLSAEKPRAMSTVLILPILVPPGFMEKLRVREPMALTILAYYGLILLWLRDHIWVRGWGKEIVDAVKCAVGPEWHSCLGFAVEQAKHHE